jgi:hypothetical protein
MTYNKNYKGWGVTMLKKAFIFIYYLFCSNFAYSFDFSRYEIMTLDGIGDIIGNYLDEHGSGGIGIFNAPYSVKITVNHFPVKITSDRTKRAIQIYSDALGYSISLGEDFFLNLYGHYLPYEYNNINYIFLFQNQLVERYKSELSLGDEVTLYVLSGLFSGASREMFIFVNEFGK